MKPDRPRPAQWPAGFWEALQNSQWLSDTPAWTGHAHWTLGLPEAHWQLALLSTWALWEKEPHAPRRLHLLAHTEHPPSADDWASLAVDWPAFGPLAAECAQACWGLLPGLHRLVLAQGRLQLSLWVGSSLARDAWWRSTPHQTWGQPPNPTGPASTMVRQQVFLPPSRHKQESAWPARASARPVHGSAQPILDGSQPLMEPAPPRSQTAPPILVLGSGLAGASAARALAERGFRVRVLDAGTAPAQGASGLPVGLMTPHVSGDDNPLSRLTRAGLRMVLAHAQAHLRVSEDWSPSGLLERRMSGKARRGRWPEAWLSPHPSDTWALIDAAQDWFTPASAAQHHAAGLPAPEQSQAEEPKGIWHLQAGWMKPAALVASLLNHPLIEWHGQTTATHMHAQGQSWWVHDQQGRAHEGQQVVVALGPSSAELLQKLLPQAHWPLEPLRGQVTGGVMPGPESNQMPSHPVNGLGSFLPGVPMPDGPTWWYGSTYDHSRSEPVCLSQDQDSNLSQLAILLPLLADTWHPGEAKGVGLQHQGVDTPHAGEAYPTTLDASLRNWAGVRCTTHDRLPVVGPLEGAPGVHVLTALGSRGITLGLLCAEVLASQICGEPLPIDPAVAHLLRPHRFKKSNKSLI